LIIDKASLSMATAF